MSRLTRAAATAALLPALALSAGLSGCGDASRPSTAQLRSTVRRFLDASTAAARCAVLSTELRTAAPETVLEGGCYRTQRVDAAEEAARRTLRITRVTVEGDEAEAALAPVAGTASAARASSGAPQLASVRLVVDRGAWRIDGLEEDASSSSSASRAAR